MVIGITRQYELTFEHFHLQPKRVDPLVCLWKHHQILIKLRKQNIPSLYLKAFTYIQLYTHIKTEFSCIPLESVVSC